MSCLTQREREALEDVFLSISTNPTPFERCKILCSNLIPTIRLGSKYYITRLPKKANHYFMQKRDFLKRRFGSLRHR